MSVRCPPAEGLIATAVYFLHQQERKLGEEIFQYFELPHEQGYHMQSQLVLQWPLTHTQRLTLEMERNWRYRALRIELEAEGQLTLARYQVGDGQLCGCVEAEGRREPTLAWQKRSVLDSPAALFAFGFCRHLNLAVGERQEIDLIQLPLPSFEPQRRAAQCAHLQDSVYQLEIGSFSASEYLVESRDGATSRIWIDELGVPLRIERIEHNAPVQFTLTRYRQFRF